MPKKEAKKSFIYTDGSERKLNDIFTAADFDENTTWRKHTDNWAIFYHLTPERKNLVRWMDFDKKNTKILELGAGCGSITSYFTSLKNKPQIVAVEGSESRAQLIKTRCNNADNLKVVIKNIQDYQDEQRYDFVTLIGVVEYSGRYINNPNPYEYIIKKASEFLKPDGILVIAIENQFGHKYLAGFNEDHYGTPFEGVSGYPHYSGIRTFDKKTLKQKINKAGLKTQKWLYPFPDYKMPKTILSDLSFENEDFDWLSLLNLPTTDHNSFNPILFDERTFLKKIKNNVDTSNFMNSFLICASKNESSFVSKNFLASHMQFSHNPKFQEIKNFVLEDNNEISIKYKKFDNDKLYHETKIPYYKNYDNLLLSVVDAWHEKEYEKANKYLLIWMELLRTKKVSNNHSMKNFEDFCKKHLLKNIYEDKTEFVSGDYLDLILRNCLVNKNDNGDIKIIDQEWRLKNNIPLKLIIDRGMYYLQLKMIGKTGCKFLNKDGEWDLPKNMAKTLPDLIKKPELRSTLLFDYWFHKGVREGNFDHVLNKKDIQLALPPMYKKIQNKLFKISKKVLLKIYIKLRNL